MRNIQQFLIALMVISLAACSGGGTLDTDGTGGGNTPVYTLNVNLSDAAGAESTALSQDTPLTATVTLTATNSGVVANKLIAFTLNDTDLASFANAAGTALTNANGVATIGLLVGNKSGAGTVTASYDNATISAGFNSAGDGGDTVDVTVGSVSLIADSLMLGSGAGSKVELTALVRDTNNVVLANIPVTFATNSGELVQTDAVTAENGVAKATLTTQTDKQLRDITVTARVQQQSSVLTISVVGTTLQIAAPTSVVLGDTTTIDVFLTDSNDNGIQGTEVEVVSALGNTISDTSPLTVGVAGKASFTYTAVNSGSDTITVSALGASNAASTNISADAFAFLTEANETNQLLEVALDTAQAVNVEWLVNNSPNVGETVTFNTTRGEIANTAGNLAGAVTAENNTDADGVAQAVVRSEFAGLATISATGGVNESTVSANKVIEFIATNPTKVEVQAFPAQVGPGETSAVRAIVRDSKNNPVKGQTVVFSLDNSAGGVISAGTAITNSQGVASTVFTADTNSGAGVNGLNLQIKGALQTDNTIAGMTDIAIGTRTLFFRFGTGNVIQKPNDSTYAKEFSIIVTDSSGNPMANQSLNVAVVPTGYRKGYWVKSPPEPAAFKVWAAYVTVRDSNNEEVTCDSEDANLNGILDVDPVTGIGEDFNNDGVLTPGNVVTAPRTVTADENGIATFLITYPQDYAVWTDVHLQVSGIAAGTENVSYRDYTLAIAGDDVTDEASPPPQNPFGTASSCADKN
ncbi:beta strand repeat-containing protein [Rheinheimera baltica]|uniref:beta strand repeat-containing protein n=1 Tax=Rheinheimera baltica TaxID=67576 RepID=UPI00273E3B15|nr:Ig-like domain-containing protein [Rheinheimera baltica]MDP5148482.1 Ig-like domain-containing protein [Rheinheimera baltica]